MCSDCFCGDSFQDESKNHPVRQILQISVPGLCIFKAPLATGSQETNSSSSPGSEGLELHLLILYQKHQTMLSREQDKSDGGLETGNFFLSLLLILL